MIFLGTSPVGVRIADVGEFSKHQQVKATPSSTNVLTISHNLGEKPKLVTITCPETSTPYTEEGYVRQIVTYQNVGGCWYHNSSNHNLVAAGYNRSATDSIPATTNLYYAYGTNQISVYRPGANGLWNTSTEYTIDLYA